MSPVPQALGSVLEQPTGRATQRGETAATVIDLRGSTPVVELFFAPRPVADDGSEREERFDGQVFERRSPWRSTVVRALELVVLVAVLIVGALLLLSPSDTKGSRDRGVERGVLTGDVGVPASPAPSAP
ncbi:MAG: hypothetical protein AB7V43_14485 [Acidimicrobiia bacterium]